MAVHRGRRGDPGPPPPPPDQSDRGKKRELQSGKSFWAIFSTQTFESQTSSPPPPFLLLPCLQLQVRDLPYFSSGSHSTTGQMMLFFRRGLPPTRGHRWNPPPLLMHWTASQVKTALTLLKADVTSPSPPQILADEDVPELAAKYPKVSPAPRPLLCLHSLSQGSCRGSPSWGIFGAKPTHTPFPPLQTKGQKQHLYAEGHWLSLTHRTSFLPSAVGNQHRQGAPEVSLATSFIRFIQPS